MRKLFIIILTIPLIVLSQDQSRLALVIGNAKYVKGPLSNPVNDALLIAETLKKLEFDIILDTNITDKVSFTKKIRQFGKKRKDYAHAFVYYAGHGIQIGNENYLLPIKCDDCETNYYNSEEDILDYGVKVNTIMDYLNGMTNKNQVNVLVLDACRDNPYESNWKPTRSLKGDGLAKISAPTGSIIAFSTDAGNTAADGNGKHTIYCESLAKNMLIEGITLDQVFRNVRSDVLEKTVGNQRPVEATQLTGEPFYLVKSTFEEEFNLIDSLVSSGGNINLSEAMGIISTILKEQPQNHKALLVQGDIYIELKSYEKAETAYNKAITLYPSNPKGHFYKGFLYAFKMNEYEKGIQFFTKTIELDSNSLFAYLNRAYCFHNMNDYNQSIVDYTKAIELDKEDPELYNDRSDAYVALEDYTNALKDLDKAIELVPDDALYYINRADFYEEYMQNYDEALNDYAKAIEISTDDDETTRALNNRALIYEIDEKWELCVEELTKAIAISPEDPLYYSNRAIYRYRFGDYNNAILDFTKAIELDPENASYYNYRSDTYIKIEDYTSALKDLDKIIELDPDDAYYYNNRADFYKDYTQNYDEALNDYAKAIEISTDDDETTRALNNRALIYHLYEQWELCIEELTKVIKVNPNDPLFHSNRGIYRYQFGDYNNAILDFTKAIELDKDNPERYNRRRFPYIALEDYTSALKDLDKIIELDPENASYYNNRADFYEEYMQNYDEALNDYAKAIEISTDDDETTRALNNRALIYEIDEKWELCVEELTKAIAIKPEDPLYYSNRGFYRYRFGDYNNAILDYTKAIELDKDNPSYYYDRSDAYIKIEDYTTALKDLDKIIELDPENASYYNNRADFYEEYMQNYDEALNDYAKAIEISTDDDETTRALNHRALIYERDEKWELCVEELTKAIAISPEDPLYYSNRGIYRYRFGDYNNAILDYTKAIELDKDNPSRYKNRSNAYIKIEDYTSALKDLDKTIEIDSVNARFYYNRADFYYRYQQKYDEALNDYTRAIEMSTDDYLKVQYVNAKAIIYVLSNEYKQANDCFNMALKIDPKVTSTYFFRAKMYNKQKKYENAKADYLKAIEIDNQDPEGYYYLGLFYNNQNNIFKSLYYIQKAITRLKADLGYYISADNGYDVINLSDLYCKKAEIYKSQDEIDLMCEDYKIACDLGNCELFNLNCK